MIKANQPEESLLVEEYELPKRYLAVENFI